MLKYKIFEWCLDTLVGKLSNNFNLLANGSEIRVENLVKGMWLSRIELSNSSEFIIFYGCNLTNIQHVGNLGNLSGNKKTDVYISEFKFVSHDGSYLKVDGEDWDANTIISWAIDAIKPIKSSMKFFL